MPDKSQQIELIQIDGDRIDGCLAQPAEIILAKKHSQAPFETTTEKRKRTIV